MIKLENVVLDSLEQMKFIIEGMRNPMNSWEKSDSGIGCDDHLCRSHCAFSPEWCGNTQRYVVGLNDHSLMQRLSNAGTEHRKYMRMMPVYVRITLDDFSHEHLDIRTRKILEETIKALNDYRYIYINYNPDDFEIKGCPSKKDIWWQMIQLLPSSYNQTRNVMMNYEVLANIYRQRKNHKLDEWREFCKWIESLPYSEMITGKEDSDNE